MRRVIHIMGMPVSLDIPDADSEEPFDRSAELLTEIDKQFSTYKPDSELSRYRSGGVPEAELSDAMRQVMAECSQWEAVTDGYFSPYYNGKFDPTGYTKGMAVHRVGELLEDMGLHTYLINAGGDILARSSGKRIWKLGVQHPSVSGDIIAAVAAPNLALATSGNYVRGNHIYDPHGQSAVNELLSVTVIGPDIVDADVLATALFAMGPDGALGFIGSYPNYEALLVTPDFRITSSAGFEQLARMQNVQK